MPAYITIAELGRLGYNPAAFLDVDAPTKNEKIAARSDYIDGYLRAQFKLPLVTFGEDIKRCCAVLVSIDLLRTRGTDPDTRDALDVEESRQIAWLKLISTGQVTPSVVDSSPSATVGRSTRPPRVVSSASRGFSVRGTGFSRGPFQGD